MTLNSSTRPSASAVVGQLAAWISAAVVCARAGVDPDLWGHLRFGLDIVRDGRLTAVDPYSFTQDVPWINHEWLSEVLFALAYETGGVSGLLILKTVILAAAFTLLAQAARRGDERCIWWIFAILVFGTAPAAATFRPQLWTILGLAVLVNVFACGRRLAWLPLVFAIWANMHGGWIVGAAVAALWLAGRMIDTAAMRAHLPALGVLAVSVGATVINPYGWRLWTFLRATVGVERDITEWRPLWESTDVVPQLLWAVTVGIVAATAIFRWRRMTWATLLPVAWIGVSGLMVARIFPLFSELAILAVSQAWQVPADWPAPRISRPPVKAKGRGIVNVSAVILAWLFTAVGESRCLPIDDVWMPDLTAAGALATPDAKGRLVLPFNWGEYAIWHWGPRLKVSIDGRRETIYSAQALKLHMAMPAGGQEERAYLLRVRPEYVWMPAEESSVLGDWLVEQGYRLDVKTPRSFIAVRADLPPLVPGIPASSCFP
jgi:hypothetical protein